MAQTSYLIALGSNRRSRHGAPAATLRAAIADLPGQIVNCSPIVTTPPLGPSNRRYANAALLLETPLSPPALLAALKAIERVFGRRAGRRWGARTLDLDIILWTGGRWSGPGLTIPHAAFRTRRFVLDPAVVIAPDWCDPVSGLTLTQLRARLTRARAAPSCAPPARNQRAEMVRVRSSVGRASDF